MEKKSDVIKRRHLESIRRTIFWDFALMLALFICLVAIPYLWTSVLFLAIILVLIWRAGSQAEWFAYCLDYDYRDNEERSADFRAEADAEGLILLPIKNDKGFFFDLNAGSFIGPSEPDKVWRLIELVRKHAYRGGSGEHVALLRLIALKKDLNKEMVMWISPIYAPNLGLWIELGQWLEEKRGQSVSQFYQD